MRSAQHTCRHDDLIFGAARFEKPCRGDVAGLQPDPHSIFDIRNSTFLRSALSGFTSAVSVVGGAGSLRGDHCRSQGMLRGARGSEGRAFERLADPLEDHAADAVRGFLRVRSATPNRASASNGRIPAAVLVRCGYLADAAPLSRHHPEDLPDEPLSLAFLRVGRFGGTGFDLGAPLLELADAQVNPSRMSRGSNPVTTIGTR